jgi:hypothetical protein
VPRSAPSARSEHQERTSNPKLHVLRGIHLPRTLANKECQGLQRISLDDQGKAVAVAVAVAVVAGTVFSGSGTLFSGAGTGSSTVTVRAGGRGGAASSRLPALMRPRRNPTSNPKSNPTANVANHIRTALCSLTGILPALALLFPLLPIVLSLHPCLNHTCPAP